MTELLLDLDIDEMRARLLEETSEALGIADELALAVETGEGTEQRLAGSYRMVRERIRALRLLIRAEEGSR